MNSSAFVWNCERETWRYEMCVDDDNNWKKHTWVESYSYVFWLFSLHYVKCVGHTCGGHFFRCARRGLLAVLAMFTDVSMENVVILSQYIFQLSTEQTTGNRTIFIFIFVITTIFASLLGIIIALSLERWKNVNQRVKKYDYNFFHTRIVKNSSSRLFCRF